LRLVSCYSCPRGTWRGAAMKVTLDLTDLVQKGQLTQAEADRLAGFAAADTGSLGSNILLGLGTVAVAVGAGFFMPTAYGAIALGALFFITGFALIVTRQTRWTVFAQICVTIGSLAIVGGVTYLSGGDITVNFGLALGLAIAAA